MRRSALVSRLEQHLALTDAERDTLDWAERRELRFASGQTLMEQDKPNDQLYIVQHGWVHSGRKLVTGGRQIVGFHYAGDLVGTSSIAWSLATNTVTAVSDCIVSELSKAQLGRIFKAQPRLAGALYAIAAADYVAMGDRLTSVGRMGAEERLAMLLLDIMARLRVTAGGVIDSFDLPLTQQDIGDAVGLTKVHVSRTLGEMERRGLIERNGRRVRIKAERELTDMTGFVDRHGVIETNWIPAPDAKRAPPQRRCVGDAQARPAGGTASPSDVTGFTPVTAMAFRFARIPGGPSPWRPRHKAGVACPSPLQGEG